MTKRYTGGVVSSAVPTVNAAGASGVFLLSQQADYQSRNAWPPYKIEESLRFRSSASAYLNRTPTVAGSQTTFTISMWVKRGSIGTAYQDLFEGYNTISNYGDLQFTNTDNIIWFNQTGGTQTLNLTTTAVYRDPSAWYHIVAVYDSTQTTSSNRAKLYVNGSQITAFSTSAYPNQNATNTINGAVSHTIGRFGGASNYFDGYMTEVNFIDGQALTPSSFGATDKDGNWSPIAYTGTYGQNGFYLNFKDATSTTTLGYDYSGNGNNWTPNNLSVTSGVTYDSMIDVPEDQSDGTANNRGSYATLNPLSNGYGTTAIISITDGNLNFSDATSTTKTCVSSMTASSGKWYFEMTCSSSSGVYTVGLLDKPTGNESFYRNNGAYSSSFGGGGTTGYSTWTTGDVIGVAWDADAGKLWFAKNNTWQSGDPSTGTSPTNTFTAGLSLFADIYTDNSAGTKSGSFNFGQRPFAYTPPSGFKTLNTFNLPEPTIKQPNKHFDATLYTGTGANPSTPVSNLNFAPDFVWIKDRSTTAYHNISDSVRGVSKIIQSNTTNAEQSAPNGGVSVFNSNGFTVQGSSSVADVNGNGATYVAWQWNAGGSTVTNTSGTISAQVRANPTAGFSIVTYTGTGANATVGHGLGATPQFIIVKNRVDGGPNWYCYNQYLDATSPQNYTLYLSLTNSRDSATAFWNNTAPTSSVFTVGTSSGVNGSTNAMVAYCFTPIAGYSAFGSYTGNGSTDGPFVYTGFRPRFILMKASSAVEQWTIWDSSRLGYNPYQAALFPNSSATEEAGASGANSNGGPDFLSNGFKMRSNGGANNNSGVTYIYMAFAEMPFKYSRSR